MRERQPTRQQLSGFIGRTAVERHHRGRDTRGAPQLRTPAVADGRDFDLVRAPANGFLEAMNCHVLSMSGGSESGLKFYAPVVIDQAKARAKAAFTSCRTAVSTGSAQGFFFVVGFSTGFAPDVHRFSTILHGMASPARGLGG